MKEMLIDSANMLYDTMKNKNKYTTEERKILIASANTLAATCKTALQFEILEYRMNNSRNKCIGTGLNISDAINNLER